MNCITQTFFTVTSIIHAHNAACTPTTHILDNVHTQYVQGIRVPLVTLSPTSLPWPSSPLMHDLTEAGRKCTGIHAVSRHMYNVSLHTLAEGN